MSHLISIDQAQKIICINDKIRYWKSRKPIVLEEASNGTVLITGDYAKIGRAAIEKLVEGFVDEKIRDLENELFVARMFKEEEETARG